jgi:hypothetical protein
MTLEMALDASIPLNPCNEGLGFRKLLEMVLASEE